MLRLTSANGSPVSVRAARILMAMRTLAKHLFESGSKFARSALEAHGNSVSDIFALHAGVSLELLAEARVAELNPALLASPKSSKEALIWIAREEHDLGAFPRGLKTSSLLELLDLMKVLDSPLEKDAN